MSDPEDRPPAGGPSRFEQLASSKDRSSFLGDLLGYLRETRKWWLTPLLLVLVLAGALLVVSGTAVAPFIYTLF